jgi:hypothetical protein
MSQRHAMIGGMATLTKINFIMTLAAIDRFAAGIKAMGEFIIVGMGFRRQVITPMAFHAVCILSMTLPAPRFVDRGPLPMLIFPSDRMNIGKRDLIRMTDFASGIGLVIIMAGHTESHFGHIRGR